MHRRPVRALAGLALALLAAPALAQENRPPRGQGAAGEAILGEEWRRDTDGDGIPDFIEVEVGANPAADDCPAQACGPGGAGGEFPSRPRNTLIMLDSSGSMNARLGGATKLEVARAAIGRYASVAGAMNERLGFLVYGHKGSNKEAGKPESCQGADLLARIGDVDADAFKAMLAGFRPTGWTPIALALDRAATAFAGREGEANRVILVSDGIETCGGDPVAAARRLREGGLTVSVDVIGFDIRDRGEGEALRRIAAAGGGSYHEARDARALDAFFRAQGEAMRQTTEALLCEFRNASPRGLCEAQLGFRAAQSIRRRQMPLPVASPEHEAMAAVLRRMEERREERARERAAAGARVEELLARSRDLRDAMLRAYGR